VGVAAGALLSLEATPATANGRFPAANQIVFSPTDPNLVIARTTYAILPSRDGGRTWSYLCEEALGLPQTAYQDPELGLTGGNALVAGLYSPTAGLDVSTNLGCDWSCVAGPLASQSIADVVVRPDAPAVALALTSTYLPVDAGGGTFSQVFQSADDGAHWTAIGVPLDPTVLVQTIDVAAGDSHRLYVSGTRGFGSGRTASLFVSTDDAAHWTERTLPQFDPQIEDSIYIGAVDPSDPNRVYLRSSAVVTGGDSRLFVTADSGQSFQIPQDFRVPQASVLSNRGEILGFALSPDGSKIYAGTKEAGLFVATRAEMVFVKTSPIHVQCLATRGTELWACSDEVSGFVIGASTDDGATFDAKLATITGLGGPLGCSPNAGGPLACGATANGSQCADSFNSFCQSTDPTGRCAARPVDDGGALDAAGDGAAPSTPPSKPTIGCSAAEGAAKGAGRRDAGWGALCTALVILVRRKRAMARSFDGREKSTRLAPPNQ
jgi:hypothetical protein